MDNVDAFNGQVKLYAQVAILHLAKLRITRPTFKLTMIFYITIDYTTLLHISPPSKIYIPEIVISLATIFIIDDQHDKQFQNSLAHLCITFGAMSVHAN